MSQLTVLARTTKVSVSRIAIKLASNRGTEQLLTLEELYFFKALLAW